MVATYRCLVGVQVRQPKLHAAYVAAAVGLVSRQPISNDHIQAGPMQGKAKLDVKGCAVKEPPPPRDGNLNGGQCSRVPTWRYEVAFTPRKPPIGNFAAEATAVPRGYMIVTDPQRNKDKFPSDRSLRELSVPRTWVRERVCVATASGFKVCDST